MKAFPCCPTFRKEAATIFLVSGTILASILTISQASEMASGIGVEDLAFMCYTASQKAGVTVPATLDIYIDKLRNIEVVDQNIPKVGEEV